MAGADELVLSLLVLAPFLGGLSIIFIPGRQANAIRSVATAVTGFTFALSIYLTLRHYLAAPADAEFWPLTRVEWLPSLGIGFTLGVDGISVLMVLLNGVVAFAGTLIAWRIPDRSKEFFVLFLLLIAGVYGVFVALDLFFFFFFYELAVIPMYLLIGVWGSSTDFRSYLPPLPFSRSREYSAMKLTIMLSLGSVLVWVALIALYVNAANPTFDFLSLRDNEEYSRTFQLIFFPLVAVGFGVLAGLWPFHTWSPDGHVAAPSAVSMVHAGVLMKLGAYGILRVGMTVLPEGAQDWMPVLVVLGAVNVIYGAISAMGQRDLKYVIGYSSVSHMGYVLMGLATLHHLGVSGAVMQMFSHGVMTALFFAVVGAIYDRTHTRDIGVLEGMAKRMGTTAWLFAIAGLASLGLPGLSGFVAELLVFLGLFQTYPILGALGVVGAAITAVYILRLIGKVFFGELGEQWRDQVDISRREAGASVILAGFILLMGLFPFPFLSAIDGNVAELITRVTGAG